MRRRTFITLLGSAAALPLAARAQLGSGLPCVGYVWMGAPDTDVSADGLRRGLQDRGYVLGRNLVLEERYAHGSAERIPDLIAELLALKVDVLVTVGTVISLAAQRATSTVPIVMVSGDPVGSGLVAGLARPGGNITGFSLLSADYSAKWLELLMEVAPNLRRVAMLCNPDNPANAREVERMREAARTLAVDVTALSGRPTEVGASLAAISPANIDGFVVCDDPLLETILPQFIALAAERRLPRSTVSAWL
jgi:putative tryptophan/tyrosine transport system substrate-binding protein